MRCPMCGSDHLPGDDECPGCGSSLTQEDLPHPRTIIERSLAAERVIDLKPARAITLPSTAFLAEAVNVLRSQGIGCVLITDEQGRLAGILSERDLLIKVAGLGAELGSLHVSEVMTAAPDTVQPEATVALALQCMMVGDHRHLPMVDEQGRPTGVVSSRDIINHLDDLLRVEGV